MNKKISKNIKRTAVVSISLCALTGTKIATADADWYSMTMDNDLFAGSDNGYTNGLYYSWWDTRLESKPEPGFFARWMLWSMPDGGSTIAEGSIKTIGQSMITPDDITLEDPPLPPDDLPYGGLLFYSDTYVKAYKTHADKITTTIGVVGEYSLAEQTQKFVHSFIGSDEPEGWDTQLDDELVFQFNRGRVWRSWASDNGRMDLLTGAEVALGTISSFAAASVMLRYGKQLDRSFATTTLATSRSSNPVSSGTGWYLFAGVSPRYTANQIFLDGNTYDDDAESIDFDKEQLGVSLGIAYSWKNVSFTFVVNDVNVNETSDNEGAEEYSEYGSFTLAWRN